VRKGADIYASESAVRLRADQQRRMRQFLKSCIAVNEQGEALSLEQIAEKSLSNPGLRRGELMARIKGFEKIADGMKWDAIFVTVTAPSAFHPQLFHGAANPRYSGATVREAQDWLCMTWSRVRSQLDRDGVRYFGFRVAEPHHDGTPHWHMLLWVKASLREQLGNTLVEGWLKEFGHEPGAYEKRVTIERIDRRRGSATGYLAKYIAKNLDAAGVINAEGARETGIGQAADVDHGLAVQDGLSRVLAWASVHGVRQFQQLGGPAVGLYREARRVRQPVGHPDLERARRAADRGDWRGFGLASGYRFLRDRADEQLDHLWRAEQRARRTAGLPRRRRFQTTVRMVYAETGRRNRYGELVGAQHIGLSWGGGVGEIFTRPHQWRITTQGVPHETVQKDSGHAHARPRGQASGLFPLPSPLGPVAITVRPETECDQPDERFYSDTNALIRQLACRMRLSADAPLREKWTRSDVIPRFDPSYWRQETTGPPH
jgi:Bacteriophage replication gene A protein (GPA)